MAERLPTGYTDWKMEKIGASANHRTGSPPKSEKSSGTRGAKTGKKAPLPDTSFQTQKQSFFSLRRERSKSLLQMLALPRDHNGENLPPLRSFLLLMNEHRPLPGSLDLLLGERFLRGWIEKYGGELPEEIHKEIFQLIRLIETEHRELQDRAQVLYGMEGPGQDRSSPPWRLSVQKKRKETGSNQEEERPSCVLDVVLPRLGDVRVFMQYQERSNRCVFFSRRREIRRFLRRALPDLLRQAAEAGLRLLEARVGKRGGPLHPAKENVSKGVNLWG